MMCIMPRAYLVRDEEARERLSRGIFDFLSKVDIRAGNGFSMTSGEGRGIIGCCEREGICRKAMLRMNNNRLGLSGMCCECKCVLLAKQD